MPPRIAITGAGGMLGRDLQAAFAGREVTALDHRACDTTDPAAVDAMVREHRPGVIVHLAAFTKVNECERRADHAQRVNAEGTRNLAAAANAAGSRVVYLSTDYVFDGRKREPYTEDDAVNPLSVYGRTKWEGERYVAEVPGSLIVRVGWLFGLGGRNFVEAILEQVAGGKPLRVVADQTGCPTWTRDLARVLAQLVDLEVAGLIHVPGGGSCTWHQFAEAIVEMTSRQDRVEALDSMSGDPAGAPRPAYSVMSDVRLRSFGVQGLPHWREALRGYLNARRA